MRRCGRRALSTASIMRASSKARGEAKAISWVRSYSTRSSHHCSAVSFFFTSGRMRSLPGFCKRALAFFSMILLDAVHRFAVNDEQIFHRPDLQHFFVERRGTGRGFAPDCVHPECVSQIGEAEKDACAYAVNRLVCEGHTGTNGKKVEDKMVTPSAAAVGERE